MKVEVLKQFKQKDEFIKKIGMEYRKFKTL